MGVSNDVVILTAVGPLVDTCVSTSGTGNGVSVPLVGMWLAHDGAEVVAFVATALALRLKGGLCIRAISDTSPTVHARKLHRGIGRSASRNTRH